MTPDKHEIHGLSRAAYGWKETKTKEGEWKIEATDPIITIDKSMKRRNRLFGIMVYTVHDLLVNLYKHEKGKDSFKWFEESSEEEQKILLGEAYAIIDFICRLIDKSEHIPKP